MPLTPFHLGPGLLIGLLLFSYIDFPTFLVASVIVDVEPIVVLAFGLDYPLHGFFHSFLGGTLVAFLLAVVMSKIRESLSPLLSFFKLEHKSSFKTILIASFSGIYVHILLDSRMHRDIQPFYPLDVNPLLSSSALPGLQVYMLCFWCFIGAAVIYVIRLFLIWRREPKKS
ncbi:MAG: hypothetical protein OEZ29_03905 [Candidatus Bathyarchaeota archaeon]|nr:hypothetical protein [Candidatus Bathyarchaeota archaeon]MDH5779720.1 hypothetical protein [Candidatus Bathyarchaeota archaeon]